MAISLSRPCLILTVALLAGAVFLQPASAQSDNDLRRENQRLTSQLQQTTRELDAAQKRIAELEREVAQLERRLEAAGRPRPGGTRDSDDEVTIDETNPSASPRALLRALVADYNETMEDQEIGRSGDRARTMYLRTLNRWQSAAARKFRSQITWHVRVDEATQTRQGYDLKLIAVDPVSHTALGDPFDVALSRAAARRFEALRDQRGANILVLRGTLTPDITINPDRESSGPFDNPRLIGPFAEYRLSVEVRSLLAVNEEE